MADQEKIDRIKRELNNVPTEPGVYLWKDKTGQVIYVGKAKQLRARMRQYVNFQDDRAKIPLLVDQIDTFEYIVVNNEYESLVLEKNLINQYSPFFNADFKDDKSYPFIAVTETDTFPAIKFTREKHKKGTSYFGPYTDSRAARNLIDIARKVVPLCSTRCPDWRQMTREIEKKGYETYASEPHKQCFDCHVGIGPGACCCAISPEDYKANVEKVKRFLRGNHREFVDELTADMQEAAANLEFERAARLKGRIDLIGKLTDRQHAVVSSDMNADVIGFYREETIAGVHVLMVREGRVINGNEFVLNKGKDVPDTDLVHNFMLRYYDATTSIPRQVICATLPERRVDGGVWLARRQQVRGPRARRARARGESFVSARHGPELPPHSHALQGAHELRGQADQRSPASAGERARTRQTAPAHRMLRHLSTLHGAYTVASMVVFTDGKPDKGQYRRFKIRADLDEANDFVSMQEVLGRRYAPERAWPNRRFGRRPQRLRSFSTAASPSFRPRSSSWAPWASTFLWRAWPSATGSSFPGRSRAVVLPSGSASLYLVKRVRDESHRFAITFHRELRQKGMTASILDEVDGVGPKRKKALIKHFKSFKRLREASLEEIVDAHVVPEAVAR